MEIEKLFELRMLLRELYDVLATNRFQDVNYAKRIIAEIIEYLDERLEQKQLIDSAEEESMRARFKSMFPPKSGLSEFYIWNEDASLRKAANEEYEMLVNKIKKLLGFSQSEF